MKEDRSMMDVCLTGARVMAEKTRFFFESATGSFLYAIFIGAVGNMVLLIFLSTVLSASALPMLLPVISIFNASISGYSLLDKCTSFSWPRMGLTVIAAIIVLSCCLGILLFCPWEPLFEAKRYVIVGLFSLAGTFLGGWIAKKKHQLNVENTINF